VTIWEATAGYLLGYNYHMLHRNIHCYVHLIIIVQLLMIYGNGENTARYTLMDICQMLHHDKIDDLVNVLMRASILLENNLTWISENDVNNVLLPIQVRKLT
jgi:hypothetical protein